MADHKDSVAFPGIDVAAMLAMCDVGVDIAARTIRCRDL
jgi:hypothetical protein